MTQEKSLEKSHGRRHRDGTFVPQTRGAMGGVQQWEHLARLTTASRWEVDQTLVATPNARRSEAVTAPSH
jgi:hypothetical protein